MKKFLLSLITLAACSMGMMAQETLTICDGTATNAYVPINSYWWDNASTQTQTIYPAALLEAMEGTQITAIKFYLNSAGWNCSDGKCNLSLGTTEQTAFSYTVGISGLTTVAADVTAPEEGLTEIEFVFDEPFQYDGGNLVFECQMTEAGSYGSSYFYGESQTSNTAFSRTTTYNFLPKTTFTYETAATEYAAKITPSSLNFGKLNPGQEATLNVTLKNRGLNAFTPTVSVEAPYSTDYVAAELVAGESVEIPVKFAPTALGDYAATMSIDCGGAGVQTVELAGRAVNEREMTICEGTETNDYLPVYGFYFDTQGTLSQMIYPADMLSDLAGAKITGIKFYPNAPMTLKNGALQLSLAETDVTYYERETAISTPTNLVTELTQVDEMTVQEGAQVLEFEFDQPFTYEGGNLAVQTLVSTKGNYARNYFYGVYQEGDEAFTGWCQWSNGNQMVKFLPKMTLVYSQDSQEPETVTVTGTVTDFATGEPIEEVNVTLTVNAPTSAPEGAPRRAEGEPVTYTAVTDAQGAFSMDVTPVEGATYSMTYEKNGYVTYTNDDVFILDPQQVTLQADESTGISDINAASAVSVKYVNAMGQTSDRPFQGVNIVITRNADGTTSTSKVVK